MTYAKEIQNQSMRTETSAVCFDLCPREPLNGLWILGEASFLNPNIVDPDSLNIDTDPDTDQALVQGFDAQKLKKQLKKIFF
jgi:hypothetical protein